jgi:hypothetical protein
MTSITHTSFVCLRARIAEIFPGEVRNVKVEDLHYEGGDRTGNTLLSFTAVCAIDEVEAQYRVAEQNYPVTSAVDTDFAAYHYAASDHEWRLVDTFDDLDDALEVLAEGFLGTGA